MAITVSSAEVHAGVNPARVVAQGLFHAAELPDELAPVHPAEQPQAADAVADRDLVCRLLPRLKLHPLFDALARLAQALRHPRQRQCKRSALPLQPPRELRHEGVGQQRLRAHHVGDHEYQLARRGFSDLQQAVGPIRGGLAFDMRDSDPGCNATQVLDQRETQHDRKRPQFPQQQRLLRLICSHEAGQWPAAQQSVAMGDSLQREVIHAGQAGTDAIHRIPGEPRQLAAVASRQMAPGSTDLFFDQVEIVEQPFGCRRQAPLGV